MSVTVVAVATAISDAPVRLLDHSRDTDRAGGPLLVVRVGVRERKVASERDVSAKVVLQELRANGHGLDLLHLGSVSAEVVRGHGSERIVSLGAHAL